MNKNLFQLDKHGFEIINFSKELSQDEKIFLLEITDNEKKNISKSYENRFFDLIKWEYKDGAGLSIYQKIINHLKIKTKISTNYLDLKFTRLVYLTKDFENSDYANQIPHFDYIRTLKAFLYVSDNEEDGTGSIQFIPKSQKSLFIKLIKILRCFYIPSKIVNKKTYKVINFFFRKSNKVSANTKKFNLVIFDTDTIHQAGKITKKNFCRKVLRFDFLVYGRPYNLIGKIKNYLSFSHSKI